MQLGQQIGNRYPNKISSHNLYKRCDEKLISIEILNGRWKVLGHILRLSDETSAIKTVRFYFERSEKGYRGRLRESIVTTLNKDIKRADWIKRDVPIPPLRRKQDFEDIGAISLDRKIWRKFSYVVCRVAEANIT